MRRPILFLSLLGAMIAARSGMPSRVAGQVMTTSARAAGLAENYGAVARGAAAAQWNPANLGLPGNPSFSVYLPAVQVNYGAGPVTFGDIKDYENLVIPDSVKNAWLNQIGPGGTETTSASGDLAALGLSYKWFALTTALQTVSVANLPYNAVEVLLYGNAGQSGTGGNLSFTDGQARGYAVSDVALSFGLPILRPKSGTEGSTLALGVTGKYVMGHGLADATDGNAVIVVNPVADTVRFPVIALYDSTSWLQTTGWGMDLGVGLTSGRLSLGFTVYDVFNTLKFDPAVGRASSGYAVVNDTTAFADVDFITLPSVAPIQQLADSLANEARFKPTLRLAAAYHFSPRLQVSGDALWHTGSDKSLYSGPKEAVGAGAEYRLLSFLPVRGGVRVDNIAFTWSVGTGLRFGAFAFDVSYGWSTNSTSWLGLGLGVGTS